MSFDLKFTDAEIDQASITAMPDAPTKEGMSPQQIKEFMSKLPSLLIAREHFNALIDALNDATGADNIGALTPASEASTVQQELIRLQNSIVQAGGGDMARATYDKNNTGVVDNAERLQGKTPDELGLEKYGVGDLYLTINAGNPADRLGYGSWQLFNPGRTVICVQTADADFNVPNKTGGSKELQNHVHVANRAERSSADHYHSFNADVQLSSHAHTIDIPALAVSMTQNGNHQHTMTTLGRSKRETTDPNGYSVITATHADATNIPGSPTVAAGAHAHTANTVAAPGLATSVTSLAHQVAGVTHPSGAPHEHSVFVGGAAYSAMDPTPVLGNAKNLMPFKTCYIWERIA